MHNTLNSTLDIFILRLVPIGLQLPSFKFHSGYIYTIKSLGDEYADYDFKFHSGYIYTEVFYIVVKRYCFFKFHSGYIYTKCKLEHRGCRGL